MIIMKTINVSEETFKLFKEQKVYAQAIIKEELTDDEALKGLMIEVSHLRAKEVS
jgi:hypothetical protein